MPRRLSRGFTLIELLIVMAIVGVVLALSMAGYRYARVRGNEASALASLTAVNQAQASFSQVCGNGRFAALGTPMPATGDAFLSPDMTVADPLIKSGYRFVMAGTPAVDNRPACNDVIPVETYLLTADPLNPEITGSRFYGTNTDRIVYEDTVTFVGNMPEKGAPGHGTEIR
jgi:type IV pilus assembly protein PilA